jgi:hypothetical protein
MFQLTYGTDHWLDALEGFIEVAGERGLLASEGWTGQVDANVLGAIQDGMALYRNEKRESSIGGAAEFRDFFDAFYEQNNGESELVTLGVKAEQAAVNAGIRWATASPNHEERFLLGGADIWRLIGGSGTADHYGVGALFSPRSRATPAVVDHYQAVVIPVGGFVVLAGDVINYSLSFDWVPW